MDRATAAIAASHVPLDDGDAVYDRLLASIGDARIVLLGEASHGTHEFYRERARITRRLVAERGFQAVAVEADWPDAWRVGQYVRHQGADPDARTALAGFARFPRWMWRNDVVVDFVEWLRAYNEPLDPSSRVGFYGVDLYSMLESVEAVLRTLEDVDPEAASAARERYACFEQVGETAHDYGFAASRGMLESCEDSAVEQLVELRARAVRAMADPGIDAEALFDAEQNARLVRNAEQYYRTMYRGGASSWNLRDRHMADTIDRIAEHLEAASGDAKIVVWEHNSHLGDARATEMAQRGELNVGQLVRERWGDSAYSVGFTTFSGTVTAAHAWDQPPRRMRVREGLHGSYERLLHDSGVGDCLLLFDEDPELAEAIRGPLLERAIGVIYRPESERMSHYFAASLPEQFDAVVHLDRTTALEPIDEQPTWTHGEPPEAFPSGL